MDLMIVNGHVNKIVGLTRANVSCKEQPLLLRNNGKGVFRNMEESAGPVFHTRYDARGLAVGDYDNDGDTDAIFVCLQDRPVLLRNNVGQDNAWIGFQFGGNSEQSRRHRFQVDGSFGWPQAGAMDNRWGEYFFLARPPRNLWSGQQAGTRKCRR